MKFRLFARACALVAVPVLLAVPLHPAAAAPPEGDGVVTLSPASGPAGTTVAFSGRDCPVDTTMGGEVTHIRVYLDNTPPQSELRALVPIQPDGSFSGSFVFPTSRLVNGVDTPFDPGPQRVIFDCTTFNYADESMVAEFTLLATGTTTPPATPTPTPGGFHPPTTPPTDALAMGAVLPSAVKQGKSFSLTEMGFTAGEDVTIVLYSKPLVLGTVQADPAGTVKSTINIPKSATVGTHTLVLFGTTAVKAGRFQVDVLDVYTTPGYHDLNGRGWHTTCEPYSQTMRCRTDIWSSQVSWVSGRFVKKDGWHFNNLTYLPEMTRQQWASNPLGHSGQFTSAGRQWYTECDTARTGRNGCRSYIGGNTVKATKRADGSWSYRLEHDWVFNNLVLFR